MATYGKKVTSLTVTDSTGAIKSIKQLYYKQSGIIKEVKEAWTKKDGGFIKIWGPITPTYHLGGGSNYVQQLLDVSGTILTWAGFYPSLIPAKYAGTEPSTPSETYLPTGITSAYVYAYKESNGGSDRRIDVILTGSNATHSGYSFLIELVDRGLDFTVTDSAPYTTSTDGAFTIPIHPYNIYSVSGGVSATNLFIDNMIAAGQDQETIRLTIKNPTLGI